MDNELLKSIDQSLKTLAEAAAEWLSNQPKVTLAEWERKKADGRRVGPPVLPDNPPYIAKYRGPNGQDLPREDDAKYDENGTAIPIKVDPQLEGEGYRVNYDSTKGAE